MRKALLPFFVFAISLNALHAGLDRSKLDKRLKKLAYSFENIMEDQHARIPSWLLKKAQGIIVFRKYGGSLIVGGKGGYGAAMVKRKDGGWSAPAFFNAGEGSWGWQIGVQKLDIVFLIMSKEGMKLFAQPQFRVGIDVAASAGPSGVSAEAKVGQGVPIYVYTNNEGLFAGVSFEGGVMMPHSKANSIYYDDPAVTVREILLEKKYRKSRAAQYLLDTIFSYIP